MTAYAPVLVLLAIGAVALLRENRRPWGAAAGLVVVSAVSSLVVFIPTSEVEPETDGSLALTALVLICVVSFPIAAAVFGWRRLAPPLVVGASLVLGPVVTASFTLRDVYNDSLWTLGLMLWFLVPIGAGLAVLAAVAESVGAARRRHTAKRPDGTVTAVRPTDRLAALTIDSGVVFGVLVLPLTALSHAEHETIATVVGLLVATSYFAVPLSLRGQSLGQALVGITVLDAGTGDRLSFGRAYARSLIVVLEVGAAATIILALLPAVEFLMLAQSGRSLTDHLLGTRVVSDYRVTTARVAAQPTIGQ